MSSMTLTFSLDDTEAAWWEANAGPATRFLRASNQDRQKRLRMTQNKYRTDSMSFFWGQACATAVLTLFAALLGAYKQGKA
jgi:hypothetical protein